MDLNNAIQTSQPFAAGHENVPFPDLAQQRRQKENAINTYRGEDPLEPWFEYISWIELNYQSGGRASAIEDILLRCLLKFEKDERYFQDRRLIKLYIKYIDFHDNPPECYQQLYNQGIGATVADLYLCWAYYYDVAGDFRRADQIFRKGIEREAQPVDELQKAHHDFGFTMSQRILYDDAVSLQNFKKCYEEKRTRLTSLKYYNRRIAGKRSESTSNGKENVKPLVDFETDKENNQETPVSITVNKHEKRVPSISNRNMSLSLSNEQNITDNRQEENEYDSKQQSKLNIKKGVTSCDAESQVDFRSAINGGELHLSSNNRINYTRPFTYLDGFVSKNAPQETWNVPVTRKANVIPRAFPTYDKSMLYPRTNLEYSPEELRAYYWYKRRHLENHFTKKYDQFWRPGVEYGIRMYPNFVRRNNPNNESPYKRGSNPTERNIPAQRPIFDPKLCYPSAEEELQFEEIMFQKFKRGQRKLKCGSNENFSVVEEMEQSVTFPHISAQRKGFYSTDHSVSPAIYSKTHSWNYENESLVFRQTAETQTSSSLLNTKSVDNSNIMISQENVNEPWHTNGTLQDTLLRKPDREDVEANKHESSTSKLGADDSASTQSLYCVDSVSTPLPSTVDAATSNVEFLKPHDLKHLPNVTSTCKKEKTSPRDMSQDTNESRLSPIWETTEKSSNNDRNETHPIEDTNVEEVQQREENTIANKQNMECTEKDVGPITQVRETVNDVSHPNSTAKNKDCDKIETAENINEVDNSKHANDSNSIKPVEEVLEDKSVNFTENFLIKPIEQEKPIDPNGTLNKDGVQTIPCTKAECISNEPGTNNKGYELFTADLNNHMSKPQTCLRGILSSNDVRYLNDSSLICRATSPFMIRTCSTPTELPMNTNKSVYVDQKKDNIPNKNPIQFHDNNTEDFSRNLISFQQLSCEDNSKVNSSLQTILTQRSEMEKPKNVSPQIISMPFLTPKSPITTESLDMQSKGSTVYGPFLIPTGPIYDTTDSKNQTPGNSLPTRKLTIIKDAVLVKDNSVSPTLSKTFLPELQTKRHNTDSQNSYLIPRTSKTSQISASQTDMTNTPAREKNFDKSSQDLYKLSQPEDKLRKAPESVFALNCQQNQQSQMEIALHGNRERKIEGIPSNRTDSPGFGNHVVENNLNRTMLTPQKAIKNHLGSIQRGACWDPLHIHGRFHQPQQFNNLGNSYQYNIPKNVAPQNNVMISNDPQTRNSSSEFTNIYSAKQINRTLPFLNCIGRMRATTNLDLKTLSTVQDDPRDKQPNRCGNATQASTLPSDRRDYYNHSNRSTKSDFLEENGRPEPFTPNLNPVRYSALQQNKQQQSMHPKNQTTPSNINVFSAQNRMGNIQQVLKPQIVITPPGQYMDTSDNENEPHDRCESRTYYRKYSKLPTQPYHERLPESVRSPTKHAYVTSVTNFGPRIVEKVFLYERANPFSRNLTDTLLDRIEFITYIQELPNCKISNKVALLRQDTKLEIYNITFHILKLIGEGSYGSVFCGKEMNTGQLYALKQESPTNLWEYYISLELRNRVKSPDIRRGFMNFEYALIGTLSSILVSEYSRYGSLIDVCCKIKANTFAEIDEYVVMHITKQLFLVIDYLHRSNFIHGDIKADNILLMERLSIGKTRPSIQLIDFGSSIDMTLFKNGQSFTYAHNNDCFQCPEMRENRPWTYQLDFYGLAGVIHVLLFGTTMEIVKTNSIWNHTTHYPRHLNKNIWQTIFLALLNIPNCQNMPNLQSLHTILDDEMSIKIKHVLHKITQFNQALEV